MVHIHDICQRHRANDIGPQQANSTCFDQAADLQDFSRQYVIPLPGQIDPIIRDKLCPKRHHLQRQCRFSRARGTNNQNAQTLNRNAGRMNAGRFLIRYFRKRGRAHGLDWKPDDEPCAQRVRGDVGLGRADVFGPDHAAMRFDNLFRDRQPEA